VQTQVEGFQVPPLPEQSALPPPVQVEVLVVTTHLFPSKWKELGQVQAQVYGFQEPPLLLQSDPLPEAQVLVVLATHLVPLNE
jgi:hypothetical protein